MRLDYLDLKNDELEYSRLVRLYDFTKHEVDSLRSRIVDIAKGVLTELAVHDLPYVAAIDGCELFLKSAAKDFGICQIGTLQFDCRLTPDTWIRVADYMNPFLDSVDPNGFQWLDEVFQWTNETSDIGFLFSPHPDGHW